jgi:hypothetical protein
MLRRAYTRTVSLVAAVMALSGAAWADSDGYYCAGHGYLAYQWNGISVPTDGHVLRIIALEGQGLAPFEVSLERFQVHGMKCGPERVELRGWDAIYSVELSKERHGVYQGKRSIDALDPAGFTQSNLADLSVAGVTRLDATDAEHVYELVIEKGEQAREALILHRTTTTLVRRTRSGEIVLRRTLYEGEAEETID